jgi:hypothetical protein
MNTINEEQKVKIINCKVCGLNNIQTRFQPKRRTCIKCNSKRCNEKILMKDPSYFNNKVKQRYIPHGKVGRPKTLIIELN